ncbi:hypothetical protein FSARC_2547 [Fusarium sarcochroum]|uniref:Uncharacterized protein n=1 Tax=Fusarium sarcochroum TaxID=1208366 RepID=A0A8H4XCX3_9HYPO|nr:hypothetical protein FSARC_2547 [Fusarium sarcochroum]
MPEEPFDEHYLSADGLMQAMHGRSTTGGWDMVVSYRAKQLSDLLALVWDKDRNTDIIKDADKAVVMGHKCAYEFHLGTPLLQFASVEGACMADLIIPISGTVTVELYMYNPVTKKPADTPYTTMPPEEIPKGVWNLRIRVPIKSLTGDVDAKDLDKDGLSSGKITQLGEGQKDRANIVLHFSSENATYKLDPVKSEKPLKEGETVAASPEIPPGALACIQSWFSDKKNVNVINYRLATVKAMKSGSDALGILEPESFVFAANGDVLSIYIKTKGSGAGAGDVEAKFMSTDNRAIRPIPKGQSASIIISHRLLNDKVFLPQLEKYRTEHKIAKEISTKSNENGFTYEFHLKGDFDVNMKGEHSIFANVTLPKTTVHLNDALTTLKIDNGNAIFSYDKDYEIKWRESSMGFGPTLVVPDPNVAVLKVTLSQNTPVAEVKDNSNIAIDISIKKDSFKLESKAKKGNLYEGVKNASVEFGAISLKSPNLNFIAAESVLAPGLTMVDVKTLNIPYDLILCGKMIDN